MEKKHKLDTNGTAFVMGQTAEKQFETKMKNKGFEVIKASKSQDTKQHIDYILVKGEKKFSVDVKAQKKIKRSDDVGQTDLIWIEFANVRGDIGWLYGKANYIAFQQDDKFALIKRKELIEIVNKLVGAETVTSPKNALYKLYTRWGREDVLTLIKFEDIKEKCTIV